VVEEFALILGTPELTTLELVEPVRGAECVCSVVVPFSVHVLRPVSKSFIYR